MFSEEQRLTWIKEIFKDDPKVDAVVYEGLTIRACQEVGAHFILRGIRSVNDIEYEKAIADMNRSLDHHIEIHFGGLYPRKGCTEEWRRCAAVPAGRSCQLLTQREIP